MRQLKTDAGEAEASCCTSKILYHWHWKRLSCSQEGPSNRRASKTTFHNMTLSFSWHSGLSPHSTTSCLAIWNVCKCVRAYKTYKTFSKYNYHRIRLKKVSLMRNVCDFFFSFFLFSLSSGNLHSWSVPASIQDNFLFHMTDSVWAVNVDLITLLDPDVHRMQSVDVWHR